MKINRQIFIAVMIMMVILNYNCKSKKQTVKNNPKEEVEVVENTSALDNALKGLRILTVGELDGRSIMIDGEKLPAYTVSGKRLRGMEIVELFQDETMIWDLYGKDDLEPRVAVFRKKTKEDDMVSIPEDVPPTELPDNIMETKLEYAPAFSAKDMDGKIVDLEKLKGKVVVLNFWFINCQPCIEEMPELNSLVRKYRTNKNVEFIAITFNSKNDVTSFLKKKIFDYEIIPDAQKIMDDYIVMGYPTNLVLDKKGDIQYQSTGYRHKIGEILGKEISTALRK